MTGIYIKALEEYTTEELEAEIYKRRKPKKPERPKLLENPDFSELRSICAEFVESIEDIDLDVDYKSIIYELAMETFYGIDIWKYINHEYWDEED